MNWNYCKDRLPAMSHKVEMDGDAWYESDVVLIYARTANDKPTYGLAQLCDGAWSGITYDEYMPDACQIIAWMDLPPRPVD